MGSLWVRVDGDTAQVGAGRIFGHHLGLPGALSGLPLTPFVAGYAELTAAQAAAGARHAAEILLPAGGGLRVLDGLAVPSGPRGHRRVDAALLDEAAPGDGPAARLARLLAAVHRRDAQALRRIVLYQVIGLVQESPPEEWQRTVSALGVHPDEGAGVLAAAGQRPVLDREQRAAAELLGDAWDQRRLHRVKALLGRLPQGDDPALRRLRTELADRLTGLEAALDAARRAERRGAAGEATEQYLRALGEAADDGRALHGLVRVHRPEPGADAALRTGPAVDGVALEWDAKGAEGADGWRLLCLLRDARGATGHREVAAGHGTARDTRAVPGGTVRYAALPLRGGRVAGAPLVSHRLTVLPEVGDPWATDGPEQLTCGWTRPAGAVAVTVEHTGPDGTAGAVTAGPDGFTLTGPAVGAHSFRIRCHYRAPDGTPAVSPGRLLTHTVRPWPEPVGTLTARAEGDALRFTWTGAADAEVRLVEWPGAVPAPGTALRVAGLPPRLDEPAPPGATVRPRRGARTVVAAVAVRDGRALAGPAVAVEAPPPVTGLTARRLPGGEAAVTLDWPDGAGQLTVAWEPLPEPGAAGGGDEDGGLGDGGSGGAGVDGESGRGGARTVTAHAYRSGGLRLPVGPRPVRVRASVTAPPAGAVVLDPPAAEVLLGPDLVVGYEVVRAPGRFRVLGRRSVLLRVTLLGPAPPGTDLPAFVCVARGGTLLPRHPADGTTVLRVDGADLARRGTVEHDLAAAPRPVPYTLRGFLLGEHATAVRLEEPSPAALVVR
ncbi:hypothetical protein GCM10010240_46470 [Streptomyces griseoviridis]|nr:hypothetical protein GCM10010240_46470 [Streptomyces griseoviridis]